MSTHVSCEAASDGGEHHREGGGIARRRNELERQDRRRTGGPQPRVGHPRPRVVHRQQPRQRPCRVAQAGVSAGLTTTSTSCEDNGVPSAPRDRGLDGGHGSGPGRAPPTRRQFATSCSRLRRPTGTQAPHHPSDRTKASSSMKSPPPRHPAEGKQPDRPITTGSGRRDEQRRRGSRGQSRVSFNNCGGEAGGVRH